MTEEPGSSVSEPAAESMAARLRDAHFGTVLAAVSLVFVVLKVLMVSHFEITTALAVVSESDTASLLVGALVRSLGSVMLAVLVLLALALRLAEERGGPAVDRSLYRVAGWVVGLLVAIVQPAILALLVLSLTWMSFRGPGWQRFYDRTQARYRRKRDAESAREDAAMDQRVLDAREEADGLMKATTAVAPEIEAMTEAMERVDSLSREEALELAERSVAILMEGAVRTTAVISKALAVWDFGEELKARQEARIERLETSHAKTKRQAWTFVGVMVALALLPFTGGLLSDRPWLPAERIVPDGRPAITGYVLKTDGEAMVVLEDRPRRVLRLDKPPVSREFCWIGRNGSRINWWVGALLSKPASYPRCSDLHP